jgi:DNA polymerase III epsilon subunit-like protein
MIIRIPVLAAIVFAGAFGIGAESPPAYVAAMEGVTPATLSPVEAPEDWLLAHVDVETTGLVPGYHEMIDIGVILTDLEGREINRLFIRIMPDHPERIAPGAAAVNGFSVDLWEERGSVTQDEAIAELTAFHKRVVGHRNVLFVAYNAWFDISFIDHLFRSRDRTWRELYHYFILDLPSMLWSLGLHHLAGADLTQALGVEQETHDPLKHTGMTGAESNVEVYRALLQYGQKE